MKPNHTGNEKLPDFKQMEDRIFANPYAGPQLVIKTNLDPKEASEENPYFENGSKTDPEKLKEYFEER